MTADCNWCREPGHTIATCPKAAQLRVVAAHGVIDPMDADEEMSVVDRLHRLRAYTRGLLTDMRRAGLEPSPETKALTPPLDNLE